MSYFSDISSRAVAGTLIVAILFSSFGVVILPDDAELASGPYPCQGGSCGCRSASQCWAGCCCYSDSEKVAWARAHGVTPPPEVLKRAKREEAAAPKQRRACCQARSAEQSHDSPSRRSRASASSTAPVFATVSALRTCGGYESHLAAVSHRICESVETWQVRLDFSGQVYLGLTPLDNAPATPPTPPPPQRLPITF